MGKSTQTVIVIDLVAGVDLDQAPVPTLHCLLDVPAQKFTGMVAISVVVIRNILSIICRCSSPKPNHNFLRTAHRAAERSR